MIDTKGKYYLGKQWDAAAGKLLDDTLLYDSEDLTTHAVVVGMTGSGRLACALACWKRPPSTACPR